MLHRCARFARLALSTIISLGIAGVPGRVLAQPAAPPSSRPTVVIADIAFYGARANSIEPGDSVMARVVTARLRELLGDTGELALVDSARGAAALAQADVPGIPCHTRVACARDVARTLGANWVVTGRLSKTSNLIWYLSGQLVDVASGQVVLDDEIELKGPRDDMVPRGATSLARRIARAAHDADR